jgi:hypothetical protein
MVAQPPLQLLTPGWSLLKVYSVIPFEPATRMVPLLPTVWAITTGEPDTEGLAVGKVVAEDVAEEPEEVAWPPQAASAPVIKIAAGKTRQCKETIGKIYLRCYPGCGDSYAVGLRGGGLSFPAG